MAFVDFPSGMRAPVTRDLTGRWRACSTRGGALLCLSTAQNVQRGLQARAIALWTGHSYASAARMEAVCLRCCATPGALPSSTPWFVNAGGRVRPITASRRSPWGPLWSHSPALVEDQRCSSLGQRSRALDLLCTYCVWRRKTRSPSSLMNQPRKHKDYPSDVIGSYGRR